MVAKTGSMETNSEQQLLEDFRNGKEQAVDELWGTYSKDLCHYSIKITGNRQQSEDIVSEGFIKLWTRRKDFHEVQKIKHFLITEVRNASINYWNARKLHENKHKDIRNSLNDTVDNEYLKSEVLGLFNEVVNLLTPQQREIIIATLVEGATGKEVAQRLNIHESTLYREKERAMDIMKRFAEVNSWRYPVLLPYLLTMIDFYRQSLN